MALLLLLPYAVLVFDLNIGGVVVFDLNIEGRVGLVGDGGWSRKAA